jgi:hypothetical protein
MRSAFNGTIGGADKYESNEGKAKGGRGRESLRADLSPLIGKTPRRRRKECTVA